MKKQMQLVRCTVNGREVEEYVDVRESLLDMRSPPWTDFCKKGL